jgi:hypothetical protein
MERAERFILLGFCFIAGSISAAAFVPALWVFLGLVLATAFGRFIKVVTSAEGPVQISAHKARRLAAADVEADMESAHSGHLAEVSRRSLDRWREKINDSRWRQWREARAQRESAVPRVSWTRKSGESPARKWPKRDGSSGRDGAASSRSRVERSSARSRGRVRPER